MENPLTIGRLELLWRPGSWRRTGEWCWGRAPCDGGCFIFDVLFFTVTWLRGAHVNAKSHCYRGVCDLPDCACVCPCVGCDYARGLSPAEKEKR